MRISYLALAGALLVLAVPAFADDHGRGHSSHGRGGDDDLRVVRVHTDNSARVIIADDDRGRIRSFLDDHFRKDCPPGLAKKHNGCLPPGQAKKHYVGEVLVVDQPRTIWQALADLISPPPAGHHYVRVDRDVLLVDSNNRVVDVVSVD